MARQIRNSAKRPPKRSSKRNPREDRNNDDGNVVSFGDRSNRRHPANNNDRRDSDTPAQILKNPKSIALLPRSISQENYVAALEDDTKSIVIASGPAGTGKSYLATLYAIQQFEAGKYKKIIITRPVAGVDGEQIGFLPGTLIEKLRPMNLAVLDTMEEYYTLKKLEYMLETKLVDFVPIAFLRGRSFKDSIIILEEGQNTSVMAFKTALTRVGEGTKMVVTGDTAQFDRQSATNGLEDFLKRLDYDESDYIEHCEFYRSDIERHPVVSDVLRIYGE